MRRRLPCSALAVVAAAVALTAAPARADGSAVPDSAEAWYQTGPACASPVGCPVSYPAGTLHVGVAAGQEDARTYLRPDLSGIPAGATLESGQTSIPLDTNASDGSLSPASAAIEACLVTGVFDDGVEGSTKPAPAVDCSVNTIARVTATAVTIDLSSFLRAWDLGRPNHGFALIPVPSAAATWQVVFDDHKKTGGHPATTQVTYTTEAGAPVPAPVAPAVPPTAAPQELLPAPVSTPLAAPAPAGLPGSAVSPPEPSAATPPAGGVVSRAAVPAVAFRAGPGFRYSAAMLLPLVFLAGLTWLCRLLLTDATPYRRTRA